MPTLLLCLSHTLQFAVELKLARFAEWGATTEFLVHQIWTAMAEELAGCSVAQYEGVSWV